MRAPHCQLGFAETGVRGSPTQHFVCCDPPSRAQVKELSDDERKTLIIKEQRAKAK